jgi:hypothetical protein
MNSRVDVLSTDEGFFLETPQTCHGKCVDLFIGNKNVCVPT